MSVKNPNKKDETVYREPKQIIEEMKQLDKQAQEILKELGKI